MIIVEKDLLFKHANLDIIVNFVQTLYSCMQFRIVEHLEIGVILGLVKLWHKSIFLLQVT